MENPGAFMGTPFYLVGAPWPMLDSGAEKTPHSLQDADDCVLCSQPSEMMDHLLVACVFCGEVWYKVLQVLGLQQLTPNLVESFCEWWLQARKRVPKVRRRDFDVLVLLVSWMIWKERNARTYRAEVRSSSQLVLAIKEEALQWDHAAYRHIRSLIVPG
ncbi:uncharacterized protein [Miscanthus floridulus]|uniref:uncharacterized protein n=1 Tax=Miscanthus floridulus TaxID=154761 RepID=UPI00345A5C5F